METPTLYHYVKASGLVENEALDRVLVGVASGDRAFLEIDPFLTDLSAMPIDRRHLRRSIRLLQRFPKKMAVRSAGRISDDDSQSDSDSTSDATLDGEAGSKGFDGMTELDRRLADELVRRGFLNRWQIAQFLAGRTKFTLGGYRILDALGRGGYGHVFLGQAPAGQEDKAAKPRYVALKVLPLTKATPDLTQRFLHEIEVQKNLSHPHLVRYFDSGRDGNVHFMVHEFIDGGDLRELFRREGVPAIGFVASAIVQLAMCVQYLHASDIIHRDIKPSNVLMDSSGHAKLSDLGLATRINQEDGPTLDKVAGTVDYMAPDQILRPGEPSPAWDIYSLGCMLYQLLTGSVPFPQGDAQQKLRVRLNTDVPDARILNQAVPFDVAELLRGMLARNPAERSTVSEVIPRLEAWASDVSGESSQ